MSRVLFQANWCPQYRYPFYDGLRSELASRGIEFDLTYGATPRKFRDRGDHRPLEWATPRRQWMPGAGKFELQFDPVHLGKGYDLVVLEVIAKQVNTYIQILARALGIGPAIAFFGHGAVDRTPSHPAARWVKRSTASSADGWIVYTEQGKAALRSYGVDGETVSVINNTIDASGLRQSFLRESENSQEIRQRLGLGNGPVLLHIGGLDESKRLDLVLESFEVIRRAVPDAELVVAGAGSSADEVRTAAEADTAIHYLGPVFGEERAELFAVSSVLLHPGKVGLVVIDSFATGIPIVTAAGQLQAPEFDYLSAECAQIAPMPAASVLAELALELLDDSEVAVARSRHAWAEFDSYTIGGMIVRAANGIEQLLESTKSRPKGYR